jgi:DNA-binding GntR family transcriptional regulator
MRASDKAYRVLLNEIVSGDLAPGTDLGEVEQSTRLGVSRTPFREALNRLIADGLVDAQPGRGAVVASVSLESVAQLYEVREGLEEQAARLAAQRRDPQIFEQLQEKFLAAKPLIESGDSGIAVFYSLNAQFDEAVDEAVQNDFLVSALKNVRTHMARIRRMAQHNPDRLVESSRETLLIIEAILDGDAALAAHATHVHLHKSQQSITAEIREQFSPIKEVA